MYRLSYFGAVLFLLCALFGGFSTEAGAVAFEIPLFGTDAEPDAEGVALYTSGEVHRHLVVEVGGITEAATVSIFVDDVLVDTITVTEGTARLERDTELAQEVPILTEGSLIEVVAGGSEVVLLNSITPTGCELENVSIPFHLLGTENNPEASGFAIYTVEGCERRLSIEVEDVTANGVGFVVNGVFIEDMPIVEGRAHLELSTGDDQEVPFMTEGSVVDVFGPGEVLLLTSEGVGGVSIVIDIHLFGTQNDPGAKGVAVYSVKDGERRLVVEMGHITEATAVDVYVDGGLAGSADVVEGQARLALDTREDQPVPEVTEDSLIKVFRNESDLLLLTSIEPPAPEPPVVIEIPLFGTQNDPEAGGVAVYWVSGDLVKEGVSFRKFLIEAGHISEADSVDIFVDGEFVGFVPVQEGGIRLALDTREGQEVPVVTQDSVIRVFKNDSELLLLTSEESDIPDILVLFDIPLFGTENDPHASGRADYEVRPDRRRLSIEVEDVSGATTVRFIVDGVLVGTLPIELGFADLNLDTRDGDEVPEVTESSLIEVRADDTELLLLSSVVHEPEPDPEDDEEFVIRLFGTVHDPEAFGEGFFIHNADFTRLLIEVSHISSAEGILFKISGVFVEDLPVVEGAARLNLDTREGHEVPVFGKHAAIDVVDASTGNVILTNNHFTQDDEIASNHHGFVSVGTTVIMIAPPGSGYQWKKNGVIINTSGSKTIIIDFAIESDSGSYTVTYTNGAGKGIVETAPVSLLVIEAGGMPVLGLWGLVATGLLAGLGGVAGLRRRKR